MMRFGKSPIWTMTSAHADAPVDQKRAVKGGSPASIS